MRPRKFLSRMMKPFKFCPNEVGSEEVDLEQIAAQDRKNFSFEILTKATVDFHPSRKLGQGGFGPVYKGILVDGKEVAVKKLSQNSRQGKEEFENEAKLLASVQHRNVVNLLGYCAHGEDKLLVYEYISNNSLDKLLFKEDRREELDWKRRYDIITGVAKGLKYLHEDSPTCIIHRDIKSSNILLDDKWIPKIADFGMARLFPDDQTHITTRVAGTNGYMAPEYVTRGHLSVKADVFSFGVVMLQLISGQRNSSHCSGDDQNLLEWAYKLYKKGKSLEVLDPSIITTSDAEQVALCVQIALLCIQFDPTLRPTMHRVVVLLSRRPTSLEEPTKPGVPGSRYRKSRQHGASSAPTVTSGASSSSKSESSITIGTTTTRPATLTARSPGSDPLGKRPMEFSTS